MFLEIKGSFNLISIFFAVTIYMSLSVLKRKSETKYNKLSSRGSQGFSLNNPRRVSSHSGQTQTQTLMKGTALRVNELVCDYMNRFVSTTWLEKLQNGYNNEEIHQYIQSVFDDAEYEEEECQDENYEDYDDDSDEYDSSY